MASTSNEFQWDPLRPGQIRLLRPGIAADGLITAHLSHFDIQKSPSYFALSYVCGRDDPGYHILCSSDSNPAPSPIPITPNLSEALAAIMQLRNDRSASVQFEFLWIDSICINQTDLDEKARQVANMGKIYVAAEKALIWLGKVRDDSDLAMDVLNCLAALKNGRYHIAMTENAQRNYVSNVELSALHTVLEAKAKIRHSEDAFHDSGIPHFDHPLWSALASLFSRDWFFRLWTFQEAALAKDSVVVCGARTISWENFRSLGVLLIETELLYRSLSALRMPHQNNTSVDRRGALIYTFDFPHDEAGTWFPIYVREARLREVTMPADRIFAIRALANETMQARIPVEYSPEPGSHLQTFKIATKAILHEYPYGIVLGQVNSEDKPIQLPSWCPDFNSVPEESAFPTSMAVGRRFKQYFEEDPQNHNVVYMRGAGLDTVDRVVSDFNWRWPKEDFSSIYGPGGDAAQILSWLDSCRQLVTEIMGEDGDGDVAHSVYLSALLAEIRSRHPPNFPPEPSASLVALRERLEALKTSTPGTKPPLTASQERLVQPIFGYMGILWPNRVFYSTLGGRFGIASKRIQTGDRICTLLGESQLFILRSQGAQLHRFIGETYVTQLCEGEGVDDLERKLELLAVI